MDLEGLSFSAAASRETERVGSGEWSLPESSAAVTGGEAGDELFDGSFASRLEPPYKRRRRHDGPVATRTFHGAQAHVLRPGPVY
jgi:hypothetical protein